jgi:hypothetical protein
MTQTPPPPRDKVRLRRSPVFTKRPQIYDIENGELAVNFNASEPGLFIRDLDNEGNQRIRKIGPVHFGDFAPNSDAGLYGFNESLSNGEMWVDSSQGEALYFLKIWNQEANGGMGAWVVVGEAYGLLDGYLDQFKDGEDGDDYIHTDRTRLKINNKTALRGLSTASGNRLIMNEENEFGNGVSVNASALEVRTNGISVVSQTMTPFQTDSVASNTFTYTAHGLFEGEKVYVYPELADGETLSPVPSGDYVVINATNDTFQLSNTSVGSPIASNGNIYLAPYESIEVDAEANYFSTGNFAYKDLRLTPDDGQIEDGHWDVYHNPSNGNVRIFARAGNTLIEPEVPGLSVEIKNDSGEALNAGDPVHLIGYDPVTKLAKVVKANHANPTTMPAFGLIKESLTPGARGYVVFLGRLEGLDTSAISGSLGIAPADEGRVVYVGVNGELTYNEPSSALGRSQAIGIVIKQDLTNGIIVVNNPSTFTGQPPLPEGYVWIGDSNDIAEAHKLDSNSFQIRLSQGGVAELALASNVKFGGYEFLYDGAVGSKVQTKITTGLIGQSSYNFNIVAMFDAIQYRSAKYLLQISKSGTSPEYEISEILIVHNGTNAFLTQYGTVNTYEDPDGFGQFNANLTPEGECQLTFRKHNWISDSLTIRALRTSILV